MPTCKPANLAATVMAALAPLLAGGAEEARPVQDPAEPYKRFVHILYVCGDYSATRAALQEALAGLRQRNALGIPATLEEYREPHWAVAGDGASLTEEECREFIAWMRTPAADATGYVVAMTHQYLVRERQPEIDSQDAISAAEMAELHAHIATVREHYRNRRGPAAREWEFDTDPKTLTFEAMGEIGGERFADIRRREIAAAVDLQPVDVDEGRIVCTLKLASMPLAIVDHVYTSAGRRDEWQIVYMKGRGRWWQTHNIQMSYALRPFAAEIEPFVAAEGFGQRMERNSCFRRLVFDAP